MRTYLDSDFDVQPNEYWMKSQKLLENTLKENGFCLFDDEMSGQTTPFIKVKDYDSIPDEDPRWDDDNFEPPFVDASLHECLFSH